MKIPLGLLLAGMLLAACDSPRQPLQLADPPQAPRQAHVHALHGIERRDDYHWLRDDRTGNPDVLALIEQENAYTRRLMAPTDALQDILFSEIAGRLVSNDSTVPVRQGEYFYHREFRAGGEFPLYLRRHVSKDSLQILLDVNVLARGHEYYKVSNWSVSSGDRLLAFTEDTVGRGRYTLRFKDLGSGVLLDDAIEGVGSSIAWVGDNNSVFYVRQAPGTLWPSQVFRHVLGTPVSDDKLVYEELDQRFFVSLRVSRSNDYVIIESSSTNSNELRLIDRLTPDAEPQLLLGRSEGHEYRLRHIDDSFYVLTNWQAQSYRLMQVPVADIGSRAKWRSVIAPRDNVQLLDFEVFDEYLVLNEREQGLPGLRILPRQSPDQRGRRLAFPDPAYMVRLHSNPEVATNQLRYVYSSLTSPTSVYEIDMGSGDRRLMKQDQVGGGFELMQYTTERIMITGRDKTQVPVSLVYRDQLFKPHQNPLYLTAYGAYGFASEPAFRSRILSLLDRGFVFAIVHVRGGGELGDAWHAQGRLLNKANTFNDFMDATDELVERGYGHRDKVFAMGRSAGGLLMGVIANQAPQKYRAIIAHVPFVDVLSTMLDASLPLTVGEYAEWGDPRRKAEFEYMLQYSPVDQVTRQAYPAMFVTTGLQDARVQYVEPLKWVSKLRRLKTDNNPLLLDISMQSGHAGASGRYSRYRIDALEFAFILNLLQE